MKGTSVTLPMLAVMGLLAGCASAGPVQMAAAASPQEHDSYALSPVMDETGLRGVEVSLAFRGDADGETTVVFPTRFADQQELWRHVSDVRVTGASIVDGNDNSRRLAHCGGCPVTVRYRVDSAYEETPTDYAKGGATIWPDRLGSYGEALFAIVEGHGDFPATFAWRDWPDNWTKVTDLDSATAQAPVTVNDIVESTLLAGPAVERFEQAIPGGTLQVGVLGRYAFENAAFAAQVGEIIAAQRGFWGDVEGPFTVNLYPIRDMPGRSSMSGTGRSDGFVVESTSDVDLATAVRLIAHEHNHTWIPRRLGEIRSQPEALDYWLSEGVTDFYTSRSLVASGIWSAKDFASEINTMFMRHDGSPASNVPNTAIGEGFWTDPDIQQLPYDRGRLFALLVDYWLRQSAGGPRDYDDLLAIMRDRWKAAPLGQKPSLRAAFLAAATELGLEIQPLFAQHIERGEAIDLPPDLFGPCGTVESIRRPVFDPGFDRSASAKAGVFVGVDRDGPAYAAGIRDGMRRLAYVSSAEGNSKVPLVYRVADDMGEREIGWLPEGKTMFTVRQFTLGPDAETPACLGVLAGQ